MGIGCILYSAAVYARAVYAVRYTNPWCSMPPSCRQANSMRPRCIRWCDEQLLYQECSKSLQLRGRLDRIYIIDLVEAPLSVCVLPRLRLAQVVESTAAGDDPRRIQERTASGERPRASLCDINHTVP